MFDLNSKVAIITGGAKGIGAATVRNFLNEGAKFVAFVDTDESSGITMEQDLISKHGKEVVKFFKCDVTKDEELFNVFDYTVKHHGHIDVVVNNAGVINESMHKTAIEINFTAVVTSTLKALEMMRKDHGGTGGTIINISSIAALSLQNSPSIYVYCATKSAVLLFSSNLGIEPYFSHTGVRVITICFGLTSTDIVNNVRCIDDITATAVRKVFSEEDMQSPQAAAAGIVEAFRKGKTGSTWLVMGGETTDITEKVSNAYKVMCGEIQI